MISSDIVIIIGLILMVLIIFTYEARVRGYDKGFKEGLELGKKLGKIDAKAESERVDNGNDD